MACSTLNHWAGSESNRWLGGIAEPSSLQRWLSESLCQNCLDSINLLLDHACRNRRIEVQRERTERSEEFSKGRDDLIIFHAIFNAGAKPFTRKRHDGIGVMNEHGALAPSLDSVGVAYLV
jgi:hypothetical protein